MLILNYWGRGFLDPFYYKLLRFVLIVGGCFMGILENMFKPDIFIDDIYELDLENMKSLGIDAFVFDIDNTLVTYDDIIAPEHTVKWFNKLHEYGFKTFLVSNNNTKRVKIFAESLRESYYAKALKPRKRYLAAACRNMKVKPQNTALVGDQLFTDIYGGKRMKMHTVFVKSISDNEHWFVHLKRYFERLILKRCI